MKNKGFTLIELLAVITILAIILLIAVPIVLQIINDSKSSSTKDSIEMYGRAVENAVSNYYMNNPEEEFVTLEKLEQQKLIDYRGSRVECDKAYIINQGVYLENCKVDGKKTKYTYGTKIKNMLTEAVIFDQETVNNNENNTFLNTPLKSKYISKLMIHTDGINIPEGNENIDCSYNQDETVMCYWTEDDNNSGYYEMNIAADGEIYTPFDSKYLFSYVGYDNLEEIDITKLNTKYTVNMSNMFLAMGHEQLKSLDLGDKFDTSNVIDMSQMFFGTGCESLLTLNLGEHFDTSNVTNMRDMFNALSKLKKLNLGNKFDTRNVINMSCMFYHTGYYNMTSLDLGDKFDTRNVTDMSSMFRGTGYTAMTNLNLGDKFDTSNVINMSCMFYHTGYYNMTSLDLGNKFDTFSVTDMAHMFDGVGWESINTLNLGKKFVINDDINVEKIFDCFAAHHNTTLIVPNQELKNKILNLGLSNTSKTMLDHPELIVVQ